MKVRVSVLVLIFMRSTHAKPVAVNGLTIINVVMLPLFQNQISQISVQNSTVSRSVNLKDARGMNSLVLLGANETVL